jgi:hypothetical protein
MCILCISIAKKNMTAKEIASAYVEISDNNPHATEILDTLEKEGQIDAVRDALLDMVTGYQEKD